MTTTVLIETMPVELRASHRAARNWGEFPHNGAERRRVTLEEAEAIEAADPEYDHIVPGSEYELRDTDTNEAIDAEELGIDGEEYARLVCRSLDERSGTGIVECVVSGRPRRLVYAQR